MVLEWPAGKRPVFVGAGYTMIRRYGGRTISSNAKEAIMMAIEDAHLKVTDIDGMFMWSQNTQQGADTPRVALTASHTMQIMPCDNIRFWLQMEAVPAGSALGVQAAAVALGSGACNYALVVRTGHHPAGVRYRQVNRSSAPWISEAIYGHGVGGSGQAVTYQRYLTKYGARREEMAGYVVTAHANGEDHPASVWRGRPITMEDYLNARLIAYPMNVFDNDMPCDGVLAVILTTEDRAKDTPHPGGYISGVASIPLNLRSLGGPLEEAELMADRMARNLYESAGCTPQDVDLKHVYDGFSPMVWSHLEAFGFAPRGEGHAFAQPETIGREGPHPVNTSGGNLGMGRIHGMPHVHETAMQMMGTAGIRQIPNLEVALCETGPFGTGACFICTRE